MANTSRPAGLSPVEYLDGNPWTGKSMMCFINSADSNAYSIGDPVTAKGGSSGADANGVPAVTLATAGTGNPVLGAIVGAPGIVYGGALAIPGALESTLVPATKSRGYYVLVCTDPNVLYEIQEGGSGSALTFANCWTNYNLKSGTNNGYASGWTLDNASGGTGSTIQLQIVRFKQTADNQIGLAYQKWLVRINNHQFSAGVAGISS